MKVAVLTLGCKVNKYESDALIFELKSRGIDATDNLEEADAYIINTCAVTNEAERKSRSDEITSLEKIEERRYPRTGLTTLFGKNFACTSKPKPAPKIMNV